MSRRKIYDKVPDVITISDFQLSAAKPPIHKTHGDKHAIWCFHWDPNYLLVYNSVIAMWGIIHTSKQQVFYDNYDRITEIRDIVLVGTKGHTWCKTRAECVETHADILYKVASVGIVAQHTAVREAKKAAGAGKIASRAWKNNSVPYFGVMDDSKY